jgi:ssDNA-binding Zn-finger/Zn-ribbon topoisomerase 1
VGELVRLRCGRCGLDETHPVGWGMLGRHLTVVACDGCGHLARVESQAPASRVMDCPRCSRPARTVAPGPEPERMPPPRRARDAEPPLAPACPRCGGILDLEPAGLWD